MWTPVHLLADFSEESNVFFFLFFPILPYHLWQLSMIDSSFTLSQSLGWGGRLSEGEFFWKVLKHSINSPPPLFL